MLLSNIFWHFVLALLGLSFSSGFHLSRCSSFTTRSKPALRALSGESPIGNVDYPDYRYCGRVMYDGTNYRGWQLQIGENPWGTQNVKSKSTTLQGSLCKVLSIRLCTPIKISGASRTDVGVHAHGQCFHFDHDDELDVQLLEEKLNRILTPDIRVYNLSRAPSFDVGSNGMFRWHAMRSAVTKTYEYRFCTNKYIDPLRRKTVTHFEQPFDILEFERVLQNFVGTHDFAAYSNKLDRTNRAPGREKEISTIRTVHSVTLYEEEPGYYKASFVVKSALYKMIRNMLGTAMSVVLGALSEQELVDWLREKTHRRNNIAPPVPAHGLCLEDVRYHEY